MDWGVISEAVERFQREWKMYLFMATLQMVAEDVEWEEVKEDSLT